MKNIVVLSDKYYPDMSAPSAVLDKYIQVLKSDYDFHIITITYRKDFEPYADSHINVSYVSNWWHRTRIVAEDSFRKNPKNFFARAAIQLFRIRSFILSYLSYPTSTKWEIKGYYNELNRQSLLMKIDTIISVSSSIVTQFAARKYKKENPQVKWITFFTDPFTYHYVYYPPFYPLKRLRERRNYRNEFDILNTADYNLFTEELYDIAIKKFHQPKEKSFKIRFVLQDIQPIDGGQIHGKSTENVRLVYAGALYKNIRNPEYMLSVISKTNGVNLDIFTSTTSGNECGGIIKKFLSDMIHCYPPKDRPEYLDMICNDYDILVNIGNNSPNQTPSKTLELLSTGCPIINFYYNKDTQYEMIERYPLGLNVGREDEDAVTKVQDFCYRNKGKKLLFKEVESLYPENSLLMQVDMIKALIEK